MPKEDNASIHTHASRLWRSLKVPDGVLHPELVKLIQDGCILRTIAHDPTRKSYRVARLKTLLTREGASCTSY